MPKKIGGLLSPVRQLRRRPPPSQLPLLSEACRSACGTARPPRQTGPKLSSQLSYAALPVNLPGGPFPRPWTSSPSGVRYYNHNPRRIRPPHPHCLPPPPHLIHIAFCLSLPSLYTLHFISLGRFLFGAVPGLFGWLCVW